MARSGKTSRLGLGIRVQVLGLILLALAAWLLGQSTWQSIMWQRAVATVVPRPALDPGAGVEVLYDPASPDHFRIVTFAERWGVPALILVLALVALALGRWLKMVT